MQKITTENAVAISQRIGKKSYCNSPYWLAENCSYEERNGELLVYINDRILNETYLLFPPAKKEKLHHQTNLPCHQRRHRTNQKTGNNHSENRRARHRILLPHQRLNRNERQNIQQVQKSSQPVHTRQQVQNTARVPSPKSR